MRISPNRGFWKTHTHEHTHRHIVHTLAWRMVCHVFEVWCPSFDFPGWNKREHIWGKQNNRSRFALHRFFLQCCLQALFVYVCVCVGLLFSHRLIYANIISGLLLLHQHRRRDASTRFVATYKPIHKVCARQPSLCSALSLWHGAVLSVSLAQSTAAPIFGLRAHIRSQSH